MIHTWISSILYQRSVLQWALSNGYKSNELLCIYPWSNSNPTTRKPLILVIKNKVAIDHSNYICIFSSPIVQLYEKRDTVRYIRHGLHLDEQKKLLELARNILVSSIKKTECVIDSQKNVSKNLFLQDCTVDVTIWLDGEIRGSMGSSGPLQEALIRASKEVARDKRYKPLRLQELSQSRIEISVVQNLSIPHTRLDKTIPTGIATCAHINNKIRGWFMPFVANQYYYPDLNEYCKSLIKKIGASKTNQITFSFAPCLSFIESFDHTHAIPLHGVLPAQTKTTHGHLKPAYLSLAIEQAIREDGFTHIIEPVSDLPVAKVDRTRLAFLECALSEYGVTTNSTGALQQAEKIRDWLDSHAKEQAGKIIYGAQSDCLRGTTNSFNCNQLQAMPLKLTWDKPNDLLMTTQTMVAYQQLSLAADSNQVQLSEAATAIWNYWEEHHKTLNPVLMIDVLKIPSLFSDKKIREFIIWLRMLRSQDNNTSFMGIAYTRGVAKLAEGMATHVITHELAQEAMLWLQAYQYTDNTMYHVHPTKRPLLKHGFRSTYWDRDRCLDTTAHSLLAATRLL